MEYDVVRYRPEFLGQVAELQRHLWSPDPRLNAAHFEWKHLRNPYIDAPLVYLATRHGRVLGMRAFCGATWECGGPISPVASPLACDLAIDPEHRQQGVMARIMRAAFEDLERHGYAFVVSLSASPVTAVNSLATGWRKVVSLESCRWRPLRTRFLRRCTPAWLKRLRDRGPHDQEMPRDIPPVRTDPFRRLDQRRGGRDPVSRHVRVERAPRPADMADLVRRMPHDGRIRHVRDQAYLSWRYDDPLHRFRFLYWQAERLEGYLVLQTSAWRDDGPRARIVDWEGERDDVRTGLLRAAIAWGGFSELSLWSSMLSEATRTILAKAGFVMDSDPQPSTLHDRLLLVKDVASTTTVDWSLSGRRLLDRSNWDLRELYSM